MNLLLVSTHSEVSKYILQCTCSRISERFEATKDFLSSALRTHLNAWHSSKSCNSSASPFVILVVSSSNCASPLQLREGVSSHPLFLHRHLSPRGTFERTALGSSLVGKKRVKQSIKTHTLLQIRNNLIHEINLSRDASENTSCPTRSQSIL